MSDTRERPRATPDGTGDVNDVRVVGRVSAVAERRQLPSGDEVWTFRVVVRRPPATSARKQPTVDTVDCAAWAGRPRRTAASLQPGDVVEATGALRRRFYRTGTGAQSRVEVEVSRLRVVRRAR